MTRLLPMPAVDAALAAVSFGWPLAAVAPKIDRHGVGLVLTWEALDRENGETRTFTNVVAIPAELWQDDATEEEAVAFLYCWLLEVIEHEFTESFLLCGERAFDPHGP